MTNAVLMDRLANLILDVKIDDYAESLLELYGRVEILGQTLYLTLAPFMGFIFGQDGIDISDALALNPREGSAFLLKRIKELKAQREKQSITSKNLAQSITEKNKANRIEEKESSHHGYYHGRHICPNK